MMQMAMVCMIWRGMCGNGAGTGIMRTIAKVPQPRTRPARRTEIGASCAAAPGTTTIRATSAARAGAASTPRSGTTSGGSGVAPQDYSDLPSALLPFYPRRSRVEFFDNSCNRDPDVPISRPGEPGIVRLAVSIRIWHEEQAELFAILDEVIERRAEQLKEVKMTGAQAL